MKAIKHLILLFVLGLGLDVSLAHAQNADADFTHTKVVEASADDVWALVRVMDDVDKYQAIIARVEWTGPKGVGGQRICYTPDGSGYFKESIVAFDDQNRTYTYSLDEGAPAQGMVNQFNIVDLGYNKSLLVWTSNYDAFMENPQMTKEQFHGFIKSSITEFADNIARAAEENAREQGTR